MKNRFFILGLAAVLFAACAVNEADQSTPVIDDGEEFYASIEGAATRVFVDDELRVLWNADDRVSIFNRTTYNRQYRFDGVDGDNSGTFKKVPTDDFVTSNPLDYVYSVYPYNENTKISNDGILTVYLPAEQSYREDTFGLGANTMIAVADDNELMFKNLCGYVTLRLYGTDVSVTSISLKGNRNEPLSGKATVTAGVEAAPELQMDASATQEVTLKMDTPVTLGTTAETATTFWLVVPPTTFEGGITLLVKTADGKQFEKSTTGRLDISRNTRSKMAALEVVPEDPPQIRYLTFTSEGTTTVLLSNEGENAPVLYYSTDQATWTRWDYSELTFTGEQPLYLRGDNPEGFSSSSTKYSKFVTVGDNYSVSGDIMSLIDSEHELTAIPCDNCFDWLFWNCVGLTSAPDLPATTLAVACYSGMFNGCSSLTTAPVLPATTLANSCYSSMFNGCTSLATTPELPSTTLANGCYSGMFYGCTSLTTAPELPATTLASLCYHGMFYGCTSLATAPELPATTLVIRCYNRMFYGCLSITTAPDLPATTLAEQCYGDMFNGCTGLTTAPELPATALEPNCYYSMFYGCTSLTTAPELPATALAKNCYSAMFRGCTSLTTAPDLPATTLADGCYTSMFGNCTSLTTVPELPATALVQSCYRSMFSGCTSLTTAPELPATTLAKSCYSYMFSGCESLTTAPALPATALAKSCYSDMFYGCESLTTAPALPATVLAEDCYSSMFNGCTGLTTAPELPATALAEDCYFAMFYDCTSLTTVPDLPATTLVKDCYFRMFYGCSQLNYVKCLATDISAEDCTGEWLAGAASTGTFVKAPGVEWPTGVSGIPEGWIVGNPIVVSKYLTFRSEGTTTVYLDNKGGNAPRLYYSTDLTNWIPWDYSALTFTGGQPLYLCGNNLEGFSQFDNKYSKFVTAGDNYSVSGDIMSLIDSEHELTVIPCNGCFANLFMDCAGLTAVPELPATTLTDYCYFCMFRGCTNLTTTTELSATTLAYACYANMFHGCRSLTVAPELPATTLAASCYFNMFAHCTSLATAPVLPAMTLAEGCYARMFRSCTQLNYVKCMATDISAPECLDSWVDGVASTGTFVKAPGMNDWPTGASGIPDGWTVNEAE